jgi:hypothetical protein
MDHVHHAMTIINLLMMQHVFVELEDILIKITLVLLAYLNAVLAPTEPLVRLAIQIYFYNPGTVFLDVI